MFAAWGDWGCGAPASLSPKRSMIAFFSVRADSFHFSTCSLTTASENLPVHWSLLTGPNCVVTNVRNCFRTGLTAGPANVALKYAVLFDGTSAQHATYRLPSAGLCGMWWLMLLELLLRAAPGVCANPT